MAPSVISNQLDVVEYVHSRFWKLLLNFEVTKINSNFTHTHTHTNNVASTHFSLPAVVFIFTLLKCSFFSLSWSCVWLAFFIDGVSKHESSGFENVDSHFPRVHVCVMFAWSVVFHMDLSDCMQWINIVMDACRFVWAWLKCIQTW